jgi:hypothetical protein
MSNFNYCHVVWHFCGESNTKKMEKKQERALRFIYEDFNSDYDTLLLRSGLLSLKIRRLRMMAIEIIKSFSHRLISMTLLVLNIYLTLLDVKKQ